MRISTSLFHYRNVGSMNDRFADLSHTNLQLGSGRRILTPADDPVAAQQALELSRSLSRADQFSTNADRAMLRLQTEEGVLISVGDNLHRIRELALQASNDSQSQESRSYIATEMRQLMADLLDLANASDGNGEYLFAGSKTTVKPFSQLSNIPLARSTTVPPTSPFQYDGDQGQRFIQIGDERQVAVSDPGDAVFNFIRAGNGEFTTAARYQDPNAAPPVLPNTGTAVMGPGTLLDDTYKANPADYTITFYHIPDPTIVPDGYRIEYDVQNTTTGVLVIDNGLFTPDVDIIIPPDPAVPYTPPGTPPPNSGIKVPFKGTPGDGDEFFIAQSDHQSLFDTVFNMIDAIEHAGSNDISRTEFHNKLDNELASLDQDLTNILDVRSTIGGRMNAIESQKEMSDYMTLQFQSMISDLTDLDYAEAISRFNQQLTGLQASQQAYSKVSNLSLFNYI